MTSEEREYFSSRKSLQERVAENYREYKEELEHEQYNRRSGGRLRSLTVLSLRKKVRLMRRNRSQPSGHRRRSSRGIFGMQRISIWRHGMNLKSRQRT